MSGRRKPVVFAAARLVLVILCLTWEVESASRSVRNPPAASSTSTSHQKLKKSLNSVTSHTVELTAHNTPKLGVCERNFAGRDVQVIAETGGGLPKVEDATLPVLKVEEHIWEGRSIQVTCNASYPVKFEYTGPGMPIVKTETYRKAPNFHDPKTYTYAVSVVFSHTSEQQSGNYTCRSIMDPALVTHIYLFVPVDRCGRDLISGMCVMKKSEYFLKLGKHVFIGDSVTPANETIMVRANERDQWVTLPCASSVKNVQVHLYKLLATGRLQEVPTSESVRFEVASGFRLKWRGEGAMKDTWGNYLCRVSGERYEKIHLRLLPPQKTVKPIVVGDGNENALTYERESLTEGSSKIRITFDEDNDVIECCSTEANLKPKMKITPCSSTNDCQMARKYLEKSCDLHKNENCDNFVDNTSKGCVGYPLATGSVSEGGILQCIVDEKETVFMTFSYGSGGMISDFSSIPDTDRILHLGREDTRNKTVGRYYCDANQFFFSHGLKWAVKRPDDKIEFLHERKFPQRPIIEVDESQVKEVLCYAPVWNSATEWKSASIKPPSHR